MTQYEIAKSLHDKLKLYDTQAQRLRFGNADLAK